MHTMTQTGTDTTGRERWECLELPPGSHRDLAEARCRWQPDTLSPYPLEVLIPGDETVQHTGAHGPVTMTAQISA